MELVDLMSGIAPSPTQQSGDISYHAHMSFTCWSGHYFHVYLSKTVAMDCLPCWSFSCMLAM